MGPQLYIQLILLNISITRSYEKGFSVRNLVNSCAGDLVQVTVIEGRKWFRKEALNTVRASKTQPMPEPG